MVFSFQQIVWLILPIVTDAATVSYTIPSTAPTTAAALDPAPLGISYVLDSDKVEFR